MTVYQSFRSLKKGLALTKNSVPQFNLKTKKIGDDKNLESTFDLSSKNIRTATNVRTKHLTLVLDALLQWSKVGPRGTASCMF